MKKLGTSRDIADAIDAMNEDKQADASREDVPMPTKDPGISFGYYGRTSRAWHRWLKDRGEGQSRD